nr:hypothetical protein [Tanacetum cinerariifolium]
AIYSSIQSQERLSLWQSKFDTLYNVKSKIQVEEGSNEDDNSRLRCGEYAVDLSRVTVLRYKVFDVCYGEHYFCRACGCTATGTVNPDWSGFHVHS